MESFGVQLTVRPFGQVKAPITNKEEEVSEYTWTNTRTQTVVKVLSYGAIIRTIEVPDKDGNVADIVMGFDTLTDYFNSRNPYFGAIVGRVANRIGNAAFELQGRTVNVAKNIMGRHHLHGGVVGFDKFNWKGHVNGTTLVLTHINPSGFEGYPGDVMSQIRMELTEDNRFVMEIQSMVSEETPLNLTNHSYFNLAGHGSGRDELVKHCISINADRITETDADSVPTGRLLTVKDTPFDLRIHQEIGPQIEKLPNGFDDNFCVTKGTEQEMSFIARVTHPKSGRSMEVYSDQPGVQLYTSNYLPMENEIPLIGKGGFKYEKQGSLCLETQNYPDAVNHRHFPSPYVRPGDVNKKITVFKFEVN